ncbi:response regulator [bacterium]|nr:response regulator [bacterium]
MRKSSRNDLIVMRELLVGKKILIVDDDDDYAEALDEVFTLQGCDVTRVSEPVYALSYAIQISYDLIIVDKNMPNIDGLDFIAHLMDKKPDAKIVLITAYPNEESRKKSLDLGVRYYLTKPFRKNDILEIASFLLL